MSETKLIVVRHGETQWNIEGRWQGHDDSPLTNKGRKQAKAVAQRLSKCDFSVIYSSDLGRALHTAEIISDATGKKVILDDRLRERHLGVFQSLTLSEMSEKQPEVFKQYQNSNPDHIIPEGESIRQIYTRSIACFNEVVQKHIGESIVIITHGGVINGLVRYVNGISLEAQVMIKLWNAGINTFSYKKGKWELLTLGEINHLRNIGSLDDA